MPNLRYVPAMEAGIPANAADLGAQRVDPEDLREEFETITWYQTQELAPGMVTQGMFDLRPYVDRYGIPDDLTGMRALDVGTFEGFWAFELERRGAQVVGLDVDRLQQLDWPPHLRPEEDSVRGDGFRLAKKAFGSSVERVGTPIYDATPELLGGQFDLVFIGSVAIHLRDPMLALERLAHLCRGRLIFADEYSKKLSLLPWPAAEFLGHTPWMTWWRPSIRTWLKMIETAGFTQVKKRGTFNMRFHKMRGGIPHVVIHASAPSK
jgi:tRNA (mo5U34)-methyltransferase